MRARASEWCRSNTSVDCCIRKFTVIKCVFAAFLWNSTEYASLGDATIGSMIGVAYSSANKHYTIAIHFNNTFALHFVWITDYHQIMRLEDKSCCWAHASCRHYCCSGQPWKIFVAAYCSYCSCTLLEEKTHEPLIFSNKQFHFSRA